MSLINGTPDVVQTTLSQIGVNTRFAVTGGRWDYGHDKEGWNVLVLPCGTGYSVEVAYNRGPDLYTVSRVYRRGSKRWVKASVDNVHVAELDEAVYSAGMFRDPWAGHGGAG